MISLVVKTFEGIYVPLITPFLGGKFNRDSMAHIVEFLERKGVHGLIPCGSTGEFKLMSFEERKEVIEAVSDLRKRAKLVVGVTEVNTSMAKEMARHAREVGADGILLLPPYYYSFSDEEVLKHVQQVYSASDLPIILYNASLFTGRQIKVELVQKMYEEGMIVGIKETTYDFHHILQCISISRSFEVLVGLGELLLPGLVSGAKGSITAIANYAPEIPMWTYSSYKEGKIEDAVKWHRAMIRLSMEVNSKGIRGIKAAMLARGLPAGEPRTPFSPLPKPEVERIKKVVLEVLRG